MKTETMKADTIFAKTASRVSDFEFGPDVAAVFDDMLVRSVPFYLEQQAIVKELTKKFYIKGTNIYDLGCSTGTTLTNIGRDMKKTGKHLIGYDNSEPMISKAREKVSRIGLDGVVEIAYADLNGEVPMQNASVVTMCWTLQFIRPLMRDRLIRSIHHALVDNGILLVLEKILTNNTDTNRLFVELYYDFKRRNGYSDAEIGRKREALENVLVPYRIEENVQLFKRNGFQAVDTFFQWYNFAGFLCLKKNTRVELDEV